MNPHNNMTVQFGSLAHSGPGTLTPVSGSPIRVWLVDDNHEFRGLLALLLADQAGFDCARDFSSAEAMLEALACEPPPNVILLDVQMREECGLDAIRPIKSLAAATQVLMLTTCYDSLYRKRAMADGATDYLLKSYSVEQIAHRIRKAMAEPVEFSARVSSSGEDERAAELVGAHSSKPDFLNLNLIRSRLAALGNTWDRLLRGAFFVRSWLGIFF